MSMSVQLVLTLIDAIERIGVSRNQLLEAAGLNPSRIKEVNGRLTNVEYDRLQLAALELSGDEALGLHFGSQLARSSAAHLMGHLVSHSATLRECIQTIIRFQALMNDRPELSFHEDGESAMIRYASCLGDSPCIRMESELVITGYLRIVQEFAGAEAMPRGVFFSYPEPAYGADYRLIFGDVVHFERSFTGMMFHRAWLEQEQLHKNPELFSLLKGQAERELGRIMRNGSQTERVLEHLVACNPRQMPSMEATASHLGTSARSLRRKLKLEGTKYKDLVIRTRSNMAKQMLEKPHISIQETAFAMGFATSSAFHHAFKQWTGMTPKEYRSSY